VTKKHKHGSLTWKPPGRAPAVRLDHDVIDRMTVDIMRGFGVTRRRGTEVGGVLLGKISVGEEPVVLVYDYETVPCEYSHGPSYVLSERDLQAFADVVNQWRKEISPDQYVVGYFRSHTRDGLYLDQTDAAVFHRHLKDPLAVALVIKPYATRASEAAFFLQTGGKLDSQPAPPEFQFVRAELAVPREAVPSVAQSAPVPPSRIEEEESDEEVPVDDAVEAAAPSAAPSSSAQPLIEPERSRRVSERSLPERPAAPIFGTYYPPKPQRPWRSRLLWVVYTMAVFGFGSIIGFEYAGGEIRRLWLDIPTAATSARPIPDPYSVHLNAVEQDQSVLVRWDRDSEAVKTALHGVLTITEGSASKEVKLDFPELRNGTVLYHKVGPQVSFKLDLYFKENRVLTESLTMRFAEQ
jgi:hypothetical protein